MENNMDPLVEALIAKLMQGNQQPQLPGKPSLALPEAIKPKERFDPFPTHNQTWVSESVYNNPFDDFLALHTTGPIVNEPVTTKQVQESYDFNNFPRSDERDIMRMIDEAVKNRSKIFSKNPIKLGGK